MPSFLHIRSAWLRRALMVLLSPVFLVFLLFIRLIKASMTAFSEFAEMFSAVWKDRQDKRALLPCPFCGGRCIPDGWQTQSGASGPACDNCGATTWSVDTWNTRVALTEEASQQEQESSTEK